MKDKEKQIESKVLTLGNELYCKQDEFDMSNPYEVAEAVIDLGYRKLPENARVFIPDGQMVLLTREEHESLIKQVKKQAVKEFAEKLKWHSECMGECTIDNPLAERISVIREEYIDETLKEVIGEKE